MTHHNKKGKGTPAWVKSTFDDFGPSSNGEEKSLEEQKPKKRSREQDAIKLLGRKQSGVSGTELWVDVYSPASRDDLAVHKKKVQEVENWIVESLAGMKGRKFLLLTGPAGCGKTATLKVLAREAGIDIQEWINPTTTAYKGRSDDQENTWIPGDQVQYVGQMSLLQDFLMRASKYKSVCTSKNQGTIVFMEEFPNAVSHNPKEFHHLLRPYAKSPPLVYLLNTIDTDFHGPKCRIAFSVDLPTPGIWGLFLSITLLKNVGFNPIATSLMVRAMSRTLSMDSTCEQGGGKPMPPKEALTALADASSGDVRSAINALQFAAKKDVYQLEALFTGNTTTSGRSSASKSKVRKKGSTNSKLSKADKEQVLASVGGKDASLFLFRALGKVLYCKRESDKGVVDSLPSHLKMHERSPLVETPELIHEKASLSASSFCCFLHHNCLPFFNNIDSVDHYLAYLTDADIFTEQWEATQNTEEFIFSICIGGKIIHSSWAVAYEGSWRPLTKPQWYGTFRKSQENYAAISAQFRMSSLTSEELTTVVVPLHAKIAASARVGLSGILRSVGLMTDSVPRMVTEGLGEHDLEDYTLGNDTIITPKAGQEVLTTPQTPEDDEDDFVIEEYED
ncbi:unnamed protein product, partial [Meganyctiphanes norvegica]